MRFDFFYIYLVFYSCQICQASSLLLMEIRCLYLVSLSNGVKDIPYLAIL